MPFQADDCSDSMMTYRSFLPVVSVRLQIGISSYCASEIVPASSGQLEVARNADPCHRTMTTLITKGAKASEIPLEGAVEAFLSQVLAVVVPQQIAFSNSACE